MQDSKKALLTDVVIAVVLGLIAAVLFMTSTADYIYPGESAHLAALWNGLDVSTFRPYPLMAAFAEGGTNAIMWKCGVLTTVFLYVLFVAFNHAPKQRPTSYNRETQTTYKLNQ